jgi:hypothetical protein
VQGQQVLIQKSLTQIELKVEVVVLRARQGLDGQIGSVRLRGDHCRIVLQTKLIVLDWVSWLLKKGQVKVEGQIPNH